MSSYELLISLGYKAYEIDWDLAKSNTLFEENWTDSFTKLLKLVKPVSEEMKLIWRTKQVFNTNIWFCLQNPKQPSSCHNECPQ
jgi:hypothetical protein